MCADKSHVPLSPISAVQCLTFYVILLQFRLLFHDIVLSYSIMVNRVVVIMIVALMPVEYNLFSCIVFMIPLRKSSIRL